MTLSFNLKAIVCLIDHLFLLTKNDIIVHYNKFSNLGVYRATFPDLKGPRAPPQNCKNIPEMGEILVLMSSHMTVHVQDLTTIVCCGSV